MYAFWKMLSPRSRFALGGVVVLVAWFFFALSLQWVAGGLLYSIAWKYSAIVTLPLGLAWAVRAYRSSDFRDKMGKRFWIGVFSLPMITYGMVGFAIMKMPGPVVYFLPVHSSVSVVTVTRIGPNPQQCLGGLALNTEEYPSFLQSGVCVNGEVAGRLRPGESLAIEGKKALGGFLIERYRLSDNKSLSPTPEIASPLHTAAAARAS